MSLVGASEVCPESAPFFGFMGIACAMALSCLGGAYGTAKSGVGVVSAGVMRPNLIMKSIFPVILAGILGIYGLIIAVMVNTAIQTDGTYHLFDSFAHLAAGLCCGFGALSAGIAIGITGDASVRAVARQPRLFTGMLLILIFGEALALYGVIVGLVLSLKTSTVPC